MAGQGQDEITEKVPSGDFMHTHRHEWNLLCARESLVCHYGSIPMHNKRKL